MTLNQDIHKRRIEELERQNRDFAFLHTFSFLLAESPTSDDSIPKILESIKNHTHAELAVFNIYDSEKKALITRDIHADNYLIQTAIRIAGKKILNTASPVSNENYRRICNEQIAFVNNFVDVSFGAIPGPVDQALRAITGIERLRGIAHVIGGTLYGTTMLAFKKETADPSNKVLSSYAYMVGLSLRRSIAEKALRESEEKFSLLFEKAAVGVFLLKVPDYTITDVNQSFADSMEFSRKDETVGKTFEELGLLHNSDQGMRLFEHFSRNGSIRQEELDLRTRKGNQRKLLISLDRIKIAGDDFVLGTGLDISKRYCAEEALKNVQRLNSLGILAGGIAHDFNNLLTGIYSSIELARSESCHAEMRTSLSTALSTMDRAKSLTRQLLTFAKGGAPIQKTVSLAPLIKETVQLTLSGSDTSYTFQCEKDLWPCSIDRNQIVQVLENMVVNAQQAMSRGGRVAITAKNMSLCVGDHPSLSPGNYVKVSINDSGTGIPEEVMPHIFDPFFTTKPHGYGLGLSTSYSIVTRHGGYCSAESEPGKGSTFHIYLPVSNGAITPPEESSRTPQGGGTIIVVDDEEVVRSSFQKILETMGYTVVCKNDGKAALDFYTSEAQGNRQVAAIILDLTIPGGMGGVETVTKIRGINKNVPVFVASGYSDNTVMKNPDDYGFTAGISKPFTVTELSEILQKHVRHP